MSDGAISQEEIDALLSGVDVGGLNNSSFTTAAPVAKDLDKECLKKFASGNAGSLAASLESMTGEHFDVGDVEVEVVNRDGLLRKIPEMVVAVLSDFTAGLSGDHLFILAPEFAQKVAGLANKEEAPELDDMSLSIISELVSQHSGAEITALNMPGLECSPASANYCPKAMVRFPQNDFVLMTFPVSGAGGAFSLWEAIALDPAKQMIKALGGGVAEEASGGALSAADLQSLGAMSDGGMNMGGMNMGGMQMQQPMGGMNMGGMQMQQPMGGMQMGGMQMQQPMGGMNMGGMNMGGMMNVPNVQQLQYPSLSGGPISGEQGNIGLIMDVMMELTVELGRTKKPIKEILGFGEGTIIELDKLAGEPVDILVNHKAIAKGEVVVIDENFGVRITEILSPVERVSDLH